MSRYIDGDLLLEKLKIQYGEHLGLQAHVNLSDIEMMILDSQPVDLVEVVRCEDCRRFIKCRGPEGHDGICRLSDQAVCNNEFCRYGARKEQP